ncbi:hypothetical protein N9895_02180 [Gammaproteobacteria bacterium]|nr:hypothetical protein [Gammaproteobacteria bacterium]
MSKQYPGGIISKTAPTPSGAFQNSTAPGVWTLEQQAYWQKLGQWPTAGNTQNFIEDVFSTYLYTGDDSSSRLIQNNIDLSTKGGLVWLKCRSDVQNNALYDTARGATKRLISNLTNAQDTVSGVSAFNTNGFTMGADLNYLGQTMASWTFRKQPKFFDVVTYTGTGSNTTISHNLGSVPGCIMVKRTDTTGAWQVYHSSLANTEYLVLNTTAAKATGTTRWNSTTPTSTVFSVGTDSTVNASGGTYVAYIYASNAGGFGLTGTDNVISCGTFSADAGGLATVNLGYEPQWVLVKRVDAAPLRSWVILDNMRGWNNSPTSQTMTLQPNTSDAEAYGTIGGDNLGTPTATGFNMSGIAEGPYIYIAIRRGPMKVPTSGTSVFNTNTATSSLPAYSSSFPVDFQFQRATGGASSTYTSSRLTGLKGLFTNNTDAEYDWSYSTFDYQNGWYSYTGFGSGNRSWMFRRAPSFFDEVCYTGTGSATTFTHNLGVTPELMIVKRRDSIGNWRVYSANLPSASYFLQLQATNAQASSTDVWNGTAPTSTVFSVGIDATVNASSGTFVNYLFATCAGVSKVGSYTGTGALQTVACGFTTGARFVLIKRTDSTGGWYYYDSSRGITSGNDPYLLLNDSAAEVTGTNYVDTDTTGFKVTAAAPAALNASGGTYIFLAIA